MNTIQVITPCGVVERFQEDGINCFLGIPYAAAKRFGYPQPVISWEGICDAKKYGPAPIQQRAYVQVDTRWLFSKIPTQARRGYLYLLFPEAIARRHKGRLAWQH